MTVKGCLSIETLNVESTDVLIILIRYFLPWLWVRFKSQGAATAPYLCNLHLEVASTAICIHMRAVHQDIVRHRWTTLRMLCLLTEFEARLVVPFGER
jgi:hypothetical protein